MGDTDDDVTVQDVGEGDQKPNFQPPLESVNIWNTLMSGMASYGGFVILGLCLLVYFWPKIKQMFTRSSTSRRVAESIDSDTAFRRQEAMDAARRKMQDEMNTKAVRHKEVEEEKERQRSKNRIEEWEKHKQGLGYRSKVKIPEEAPTTTTHVIKKKDPKKRLKPDDYNPLIGSSSGSTFRPRPNLSQGG